MHVRVEIRLGSDFISADAIVYVEDGVVNVAVKLGGVSVVHQRVHDVAFVDRLASCGVAQNALERYRVFVEHLDRHTLSKLHSAGGSTQAQPLETVGLCGHVAQDMYFLFTLAVERGEFHRRDNVHVVALSEHCGA